MADDTDSFGSVQMPDDAKGISPVRRPVKPTLHQQARKPAPPAPPAPAKVEAAPPAAAPLKAVAAGSVKMEGLSQSKTRPGELARAPAKRTAEVCGLFALGDEAKGLLRDDLTPLQFLDLMIGKQLFQDATRFLAHALPKREAVWWACRCAAADAGAKPPRAVSVALHAAATWVADPSEANRRAAMPAATAAEFGTPAGCAAVSAFWSGGSLGPPEAPVIPPKETMTAQGVVGAVLLSAASSPPDKVNETFRKLLAAGIEVANGASRWKERISP